ncbi:MAG: PaaI family thioesterase [Phycisphaerales bacterium]
MSEVSTEADRLDVASPEGDGAERMDSGGSLAGQPIEPPTGRRTRRRVRAGEAVTAKRTLLDRVEAFISRLSTRNNFWHRVCSLIWLPYAFRSGIVMKRLDDNRFQAVLPFRKFNRNWYNAMAGAALLGNSEIAGGMYVFGLCGGDYTVVCKKLEYRFLRPCLGPAVYKITPRNDTDELLSSGKEFDIEVQMDIYQAITRPGDKEKRVGRSVAVFHATPKLHQRSRGRF